MSTLSLADALVAIAQNPSCHDTGDAAFIAARATWGDLVDRIRPNRSGSRSPPRRDDEEDADDEEGDELASGA